MGDTGQPTNDSSFNLGEGSEFIYEDSAMLDMAENIQFPLSQAATEALQASPETSHRREDDAKSNIDELQSTQNFDNELSADQTPSAVDPAEQYFPILGPVSARHLQCIKRLLDVASQSYITQTDQEITRIHVDEVPEILNAMVQTVSHSSGSLVSARSISYNCAQPDEPLVYSTMTARADGLISNDNAQEEVAYFAHEMFSGLGPFMEQNLYNAFPTVYTSPDWFGRPVLCPPHGRVDQQQLTLRRYFSVLRAWQGLPVVELDDISPGCVLHGRRLIAPARWPSYLVWDTTFSKWSSVMITGVYLWIFQSQRRLLAQDEGAQTTAIQWIEASEDEPYRLMPHPEVPLDSLYTEHEAAYYQAMQRFNFGDEAYAPLTAEPYQLFSGAFRKAFSHILIAPVLELIDHVEINERLEPPQGQAELYTHPLLLAMPDCLTDMNEWLSKFEVPPAVYNYDNKLHGMHSIVPLYSFVCHDHGLMSGDRVFGGCFGAYRIACCVLVYARLMDDMANRRLVLGPKALKLSWTSTEGIMLLDIAKEVTTAIKDSISRIERPKLPEGTELTPWRPKALLYRREGHAEVTRMTWPYHHWGTDNPWNHVYASVQAHNRPRSRTDSAGSSIGAPSATKPQSPNRDQIGTSPSAGPTTSATAMADVVRLPVREEEDRPSDEATPSKAASSAEGSIRPRPRQRPVPPASNSPTRSLPKATDDDEDSGDGVFDLFNRHQEPRNQIRNPYAKPVQEPLSSLADDINRPSTEKPRPKELPDAAESTLGRRARSADPRTTRHANEAQESGNALGLTSGASAGPLKTPSGDDAPADLTTSFLPEESSTPHARSRALVRDRNAYRGLPRESRATGKSSVSHHRSVSVSAASLGRPSSPDLRLGLSKPTISLAIGKGQNRLGVASTAPKQSSPLASPAIHTTQGLPEGGNASPQQGDEAIAGSNLAFAASQNTSRRSATPSTSRDRALASAAPQRHQTRAVSTAQKRAHEASAEKSDDSSGPKRPRSGSRTRGDV